MPFVDVRKPKCRLSHANQALRNCPDSHLTLGLHRIASHRTSPQQQPSPPLSFRAVFASFLSFLARSLFSVSTRCTWGYALLVSLSLPTFALGILPLKAERAAILDCHPTHSSPSWLPPTPIDLRHLPSSMSQWLPSA